MSTPTQPGSPAAPNLVRKQKCCFNGQRYCSRPSLVRHQKGKTEQCRVYWKTFNFRNTFHDYLFGLPLYFQDGVLLFFKKIVFCSKAGPICHCYTVYVKSSIQKNDSSSFQHPKNVNGPANSYSSCKTKLKCLLQREALLRCFQKSLSLQLPLDLPTLYPPGQPSHCMMAVCDSLPPQVEWTPVSGPQSHRGDL